MLCMVPNLFQNFRDGLQEMWKTSMTYLPQVLVAFTDSCACIPLPVNKEGWKIVPDIKPCKVSSYNVHTAV